MKLVACLALIVPLSLYSMDKSLLKPDESIAEGAAYFVIHGEQYCLRYAIPHKIKIKSGQCHANDEQVKKIMKLGNPIALFYNPDDQMIGNSITLSDHKKHGRKKALYKLAEPKLDPQRKIRAITGIMVRGALTTLRLLDKNEHFLIKILSTGNIPLSQEDKQQLTSVDITQLCSIKCAGKVYPIDQNTKEKDKK